MTMPDASRRSFIRGGAVALLGFGSMPRFLVRAAHAGAPTRSRVLIAIFQRGAVDGLSMVVPHGDAAYYAARPGIAIPRPAAADGDTAIDLDGHFGLHPALAPLKAFWDGGRLAVVHACGSPDHSRSHFDAQDYMESGTPGVKSTPDGWLARGVRATSTAATSPFRTVAMGPRLPRILSGQPDALAIGSMNEFDVSAGPATSVGRVDARRGFEAMYEEDVHDALHGTGRETFEAIRVLRTAQPMRIAPAPGVEYPRGRFGERLAAIAQLIKADVGLEVAFTDVGGWDTHVGQGNQQGQLATRLGEFAAGLAALDRDLGDRMEQVLVLTMSEFGRTVRENGNRGTDHGHGNAMLVLGGRVSGGRVHGRWPGLAPEQLFEGRDLAVTTDFRSLFAEVAIRHLGVPITAPLFPGFAIDPARYPGVLPQS